MSYAVEHASALADLMEAGSAVTFSFANPGTYTRSTGAFTGAATTTVTGYAIQTKERRKFGKDTLVAMAALALLFCPTTYGEAPALGSTVSWGGATYTATKVSPVAIAGEPFLAYVELA